MALIDSHCHLDFPVFDNERASILQACREADIKSIVIPGVCQKDWHSILALCAQEEMLYPALGLHPCFINEHHENDLEQLNQLCAPDNYSGKKKSPIAIGEIGLDYFIKSSDRKQQYYYFSQQLDIALQYQLPVLVHARKSHNDVLNALRERPALRGIIHAYSGSYEQAKEYLKRGFKLGFGGAYTYPQASRLRSLVARLPVEAWVVETDAPDMSPIEHYGEKNSPHYLPEIARELALLYDSKRDFKEINIHLEQNIRELFPFI